MMVAGNTAMNNKIYSVGNDRLWVYTVTPTGDPLLETSISIAGANKIFNDGAFLFVCDATKPLTIYNSSLEALGTFDAGAPIIDAAAPNGVLYLVLYNSTSLKIVDYSSPVSPFERATFTLPYKGAALSFPENNNTLFVASNKTHVFGNEQGYFQAIDVSNPASPVLLSERQIASGNKIHNLHAAGDVLFIGGSSNSDAQLEAYDVNDPANSARIKASPFLGSALADIAYFRGYIFAALPQAGSMISYRWDSGV
ncbi:MAG: hypothetical protein ACUVWA_14375 [Candidatus Oleimicrobiaceae bacterium]